MENCRVVDLIVDGKVEEELLGASLELVEVVIDKPVARDWSGNIAMRWARVFAVIARATRLSSRLVGQGEGRRVKYRPEEGAQPRSKQHGQICPELNGQRLGCSRFEAK
jgi:hypothetical protein